MSETATKLLAELPGLSTDERVQLAQELLHSLDEDLLPDDAAFHAELDARLKAVANCTFKLLRWEEARLNLRAELVWGRVVRQSGARREAAVSWRPSNQRRLLLPWSIGPTFECR